MNETEENRKGNFRGTRILEYFWDK